jgi:hypothetical protein
MKFIEHSIIEQASIELNNFEDSEIEGLVDRFSHEQPYILAYLMAAFDEEIDEDERELLFFLGVKLWWAIIKIETKLPMIAEQAIDEADMDNESMLEYLSQESEEGFEDFAETLLTDYPQRDLLEFALSAVMEDEDEDDEDEFYLSDDAKGIIFIVLKTVIDAFQKI